MLPTWKVVAGFRAGFVVRTIRVSTARSCVTSRSSPTRMLMSRRAYSEGDGVPTDSNNALVGVASETPGNVYHGRDIGVFALGGFSPEVAKILHKEINPEEIELKPSGVVYLPEMMYRRILNQAFGPGGWALVPRGETIRFQEYEMNQLVTREYILYCHGRYVAQAMGEHTFYSKGDMLYGRACEAVKANALMRCCKDLGVASSLWDPQFAAQWKKEHGEKVWCEHAKTKERKMLWRKHNGPPIPYPWKKLTTPFLQRSVKKAVEFKSGDNEDATMDNQDATIDDKDVGIDDKDHVAIDDKDVTMNEDKEDAKKDLAMDPQQ